MMKAPLLGAAALHAMLLVLPAMSHSAESAEARLKADVEELAGAIGERSMLKPDKLAEASQFVERRLTELGLKPQAQEYEALAYGLKLDARNWIARPLPLARPLLIVGAHYDSAPTTPGADDNASGVAALLELARRFKKRPPSRALELRLVAFSTEEPPFFETPYMGSNVYLQSAQQEGRRIAGMISLEMLGYYDAKKGAQTYPDALKGTFPDTGDFVGIVGNEASQGFVERLEAGYKKAEGATKLVAAALPDSVQGIERSDHYWYWKAGIEAVMITDTAFLRNKNYHKATDIPATLDYARMAKAVDGIEAAIRAVCADYKAAGGLTTAR